jgi:hypothetical protein
MEDINFKLTLVLERLDDIDAKLKALQRGNDKLETHIDLVEQVAETVKYPIKRLFNIDIGNCLEYKRLDALSKELEN